METLKDDGGQADLENRFKNIAARFHFLETRADFPVEFKIQPKSDAHGYALSEDGCDGGACDAHIENENENGVKYDIRERAAQLHRHSQSGFTRSTEAAFLL